MKKNSHLHILIETPALSKLREEANEEGLSLGQYCRNRLKRRTQLDRIEMKLDKIVKYKPR